MSIEPINTAPIQQFIKQVQGAENSRQKDIRLDITAAKNLARLNGDLEKLVKESKSSDDEIIQVQIGSSGNWQ